MQFIAKAPLYKIIRITGPQHNLLGLQIAPGPMAGMPVIEALDRPSGEPGQLVEREVIEQVMHGVDEASRELNQTYGIEKIQYISTDSPPVEVYRYLAIEILRRVAVVEVT